MAPTLIRHAKAWRASLAVLGVALIVTAGVYWVLHASSRRTDRRVNGIVCVTRPFIQGQRARNLFVAQHDPDPAKRATAAQAVAGADSFLSGLVTSPANFNCGPLLKQLLKEKKARDQRRPHGP